VLGRFADVSGIMFSVVATDEHTVIAGAEFEWLPIQLRVIVNSKSPVLIPRILSQSGFQFSGCLVRSQVDE
jgi:hypothetical protein